MSRLIYKGRSIVTKTNESVLDAFLRHGLLLPFSCRGGTCHVCLQRCVAGRLTSNAQQGLPQELCAKGYFLPCQCIPVDDMEIVPPDRDDLYMMAVVREKKALAPDVYRFTIEPSKTFSYRPGNFINIRRGEIVRSYSLASLPEDGDYLEIHIQRVANGALSNWLCTEMKAGDELEIQGPNGEFLYQSVNRAQPLLLVGFGTGLAPLLGVIRDALHCRHTGPIHLYHGSHTVKGLYLSKTLRQLEERRDNFHYHEVLSTRSRSRRIRKGNIVDLAFAPHQSLAGWEVYVAGSAELLAAAEEQALRCNAGKSHIHTDYFAFREATNPTQSPGKLPPPSTARVTDAGTVTPRTPDPELWEALGNGKLLTDILTTFYGRVFRDPRLSPFFHGVTEQRLIEKQYSFLRQRITGQKGYFGQHPRNAHHWMVISDALFDYREQLMIDCMRKHGLPEPFIHRLSAIEEATRNDIVKANPINRVVDGVEIVNDGFGEAVLEIGAICDSCGHEVGPGVRVRYHLRMGTIYCQQCQTPE